MLTGRTAYAAGLALAIFAVLFLVYVILAVGLLGVEGDPADDMYKSVLLVGVLGALLSRLKARGMAYTLLAMALAQAACTAFAFAAGKHLSPVSSIYELLGVNAIFFMLFCAAAALFWRAGQAGETPA